MKVKTFERRNELVGQQETLSSPLLNIERLQQELLNTKQKSKWQYAMQKTWRSNITIGEPLAFWLHPGRCSLNLNLYELMWIFKKMGFF
jgi:hypothetical protein